MKPTPNDHPAAPSAEETARVQALRALFVEHILAITDNVMDIEKTLALAFPDIEDEDNQAALAQLDDLKRCLDSFRPLNAAQVVNLQAAWDTEYTYESNRIEGNTLTLNETHLVINEGITIGGKSLNEHLEAINHRDALDAIKRIASSETALTEREMQDIHRLILRAIDDENAGFLRAHCAVSVRLKCRSKTKAVIDAAKPASMTATAPRPPAWGCNPPLPVCKKPPHRAPHPRSSAPPRGCQPSSHPL